MNFADIKIGDTATVSQTFSQEDVIAFSKLSTDYNPVHLDEDYAKNTIFKGKIVHGLLVASLISSVLGTKLPGEGSIYMSQDLKFLKPVRVGDKCTAKVVVLSKREDKQILVLETTVTVNDVTEVISGQAVMKKL